MILDFLGGLSEVQCGVDTREEFALHPHAGGGFAPHHVGAGGEGILSYLLAILALDEDSGRLGAHANTGEFIRMNGVCRARD